MDVITGKRLLDNDDRNDRSKRRRQQHIQSLIMLCDSLPDEQLDTMCTKLYQNEMVKSHLSFIEIALKSLKMPFLVLPTELILKIFSYVVESVTEAFQLALVCKYWYSLTKTFDFWKLWIDRNIKYKRGLRYLFDTGGIEAVVLCNTRKVCNKLSTIGFDGWWCHMEGYFPLTSRETIVRIMGKYHGHNIGFTGPAVVAYYDCSTYEGQLDSCNRRNGYGTHYRKDGSCYEGEWVNNRKHGYGTTRYSKVAYHRGTYVEDKFDGHGIYVNKVHYAGCFKNGHRCGYGKCRYPGGNYYEGNWLNNQRCGAGTLYYTGGDVYTGDWLNNKQHGFGVLYVADEKNKSIYDQVHIGHFKEGLPHGSFTHIWCHNQAIAKGAAVDDNWQGLCKIYYRNNDRAELMFKNDSVSGESRYYLSNGNIIVLYHEEGRRCGYLFILYANGDKYVALVRDHVATGSFTILRPSSQRALIDPFESMESGDLEKSWNITFKLAIKS